MSEWYGRYRKLKETLSGEGMELLTSQGDFKRNYNVLRLKEHGTMNEEKTATEFLAMLQIMGRGGNIASNITISDTRGRPARINRYWLERNVAISVESIDKRNTKDVPGVQLMSIQIPSDVRDFFRKKGKEFAILEGW